MRAINMTNKTPPEENNELKWVEIGLLRKDRIVDAAALIEASRYLHGVLNTATRRPCRNRKQLSKGPEADGSVHSSDSILRPFAAEQALKAMYEWENDHKQGLSGHKLIELYRDLSPQSQKLLKEQYLANSRSRHDESGIEPIIPIEELLEEFNNAFQEKRYFTEKANFKTRLFIPQ